MSDRPVHAPAGLGLAQPPGVYDRHSMTMPMPLGSVRRGFVRGWRRTCIGTWTSLAIALVASSAWTAPSSPADQSSSPFFRYGICRSMLTEVQENDARAAMKVWAATATGARSIETDPDPILFNGPADLAVAFSQSRIDGATLTTPEYAALDPSQKADPVILGIVNGRAATEYVLLSHRDVGIKAIQDLAGRDLTCFVNPTMSVARPWLDLLLLEQGLPPAERFFGKLSQDTKLTKTVLPVFFGKSAACLVTRRGFDMMTELNPQVGRQLAILAVSPPVIPSVGVFRPTYPASQRARIESVLVRLEELPAGRQLLNLFQIDGMILASQDQLSETLELLTRLRQLRPPTELGQNP